MSSTEWAHKALSIFDAVVGQAGHLRERPGQRRMAQQVAHTFSEADLGEVAPDEATGLEPEPVRSVAVIQAGTGVGKSLAYTVPAVVLALERNTRVLISTATVALQEQLVNKDLPALAASLPQPFRFALAKGRGRYVCKLKLERWLGGTDGDAHDFWDTTEDMFGDAAPAKAQPAAQPEVQHAERLAFYQALSDQLTRGRWDGDRDNLPQAPEVAWWGAVAAEASSCTARHCPAYNECVYYEQRKALVGAQVIVVNHDLLLSSLQSRSLPELDNCLLVLDEAHHLPGTALDQFAASMDLSRLTWIERLSSYAVRAGGLLAVSEVAEVAQHAALLRQSLQEVARVALEVYGDELRAQPTSAWGPARVRVPGGVLPDELVVPLTHLNTHAEAFLAVLRLVSAALRLHIRDNPDEARRWSQIYAQLGTIAPRLEAVQRTTQLLLQAQTEDDAPVAKWFTLEVVHDLVVLHAHASPTLPGATLRQHVWSKVRAAVLTSATLTSCGHFDFFLKESGLNDHPAAVALEVPSPFDFERQGRLVLAETQADPRQAAAFTAEMVQALLADLQQVQHGALVLFTSRAALKQAEEALPEPLRTLVLSQTAWPRGQLLARHRERVAAGQPSIIFGLQSFGEGLDLPGQLCQDLFITKLPFAPPDDPVGEARAEWLRSVGRDPFSELVVPATAIRLAQWVGRAIRTEEDEAHVYCYDRRLAQTGYGQRLLQGLPPFTRVRRAAVPAF